MDTKETIKLNNELIARFMGWTSRSSEAAGAIFPSIKYWKAPDSTKYGYSYPNNYHSSWNALMPVVEKIEKMGMSTDIHYFCGVKKNSTGFYGATFIGYAGHLSVYDKSNHPAALVGKRNAMLA